MIWINIRAEPPPGGNMATKLIKGTSRNDKLVGTDSDELFYGFDGNDAIFANGGNDVLDGGAGADNLHGGGGDDSYFGGAGNDNVADNAGSNLIYGGSGNDSITLSSTGAAVVYGDGFDSFKLTGNKVVPTGAVIAPGNDTIVGGSGGDTLYGDSAGISDQGGNDVIDGGAGNDLILGEGGDDTVAGGAGTDVLTGGVGADTFGYQTVFQSTASTMDTITDFTPGEDRIDLSALNSSGLFWGGSTDVVANSVWVTHDGTDTYVHANVDGNTDFVIRLTGMHTLGASDFVGVHELGKGIDGYIVGATVFADTDGDGQLDPGEASTTTNAAGGFTPLLGASGTLVLTGGYDTSRLTPEGEAAPFEGVLRAPEGSSVITPLTTLIVAVMEQYAAGGTPISVLQAEDLVKAALGLESVAQSLTSFDPIDALLDTDPTNDDDGAAAFTSSALLIGTASMGAGLISGASGETFDNAMSTMIAAVAASIMDQAPDPTAAPATLEIDLTTSATVSALLVDAGADSATADAGAALITEINTATTEAAVGASGEDLLGSVTQVSAVALTTAVDTLTSAGEAVASGSTDPYAGIADLSSNLEAAISDASAQLGDLNGGDLGGSSDDLMVGTQANDVLEALAGNDTLQGLGGNDQLIGGDGDDLLEGGTGNDVLRGGPGNDVLNAGTISQLVTAEDWLDLDRADFSTAAGPVSADLASGLADDGEGGLDALSGIEGLTGSEFDDFLNGTDSTFYEFFVGGPGDDTIDGRGFVDRVNYVDATGAVSIVLGSGIANSPSSVGTVTGDASVGTDTLSNVELLRGTNFDDTFVASAFVSASQPGGLLSTFNEFEGGGGDDEILGNGATRVSYQNAPGAVTVELVGPDTVYGGSYGSASGGNGNDTLYGVNAIYGSNHSDTFYGGTTTGSQNYYGRGGNDTINGGPGYDQVRYAFDGPVTTGITVNLAAGTVIGEPAYTGTDALSSVEAIQGSVVADLYDARGFTADTNPTPSPNAGSLGTFNEIEGMAGDDTVVGNGNTRISFISAREGVTVDLDVGTAVYELQTVRLGTATGGASVGTDTIYGGVTAIRGSNFDDSLTGYNNGSGFAQVYQGRGGNDTIAGGGGFDRAEYNEDFAASGISVVRDATYANTLIVTGDPLAIGTDILQDIASVRGTAFADRYDARGYSSGVALGTFNEFEGMAGNDIVIGNGLFGNFATRVSFALATGPVIVQNSGGTSIDPTSGLTLEGMATGGTSVGTDQFTGINYFQGSGFGDTLIGSDSKNETFRPGNGNDSIDGGGGVDVLDFRDASAGINIVLQSGSDSGGYWTTGALPGLGGDSYKNIEGISGSNFNDIIRGSSADDSLSGGSGDDFLYGDAGNSTFTAALGSDTLLGGDGNDTLQPGAIAAGGFQFIDGGVGNDTYDRSNVSSAFNLTINLADGTNPGASGLGIRQLLSIESVIGGNGNDSITGDLYANRLDGFNGNDTISGGAGDDSLYGSAGNDTLTGEAGADILDGGVTAGAPFELDAVSYLYAGSAVSVNLLTGLASVSDDAADHDVVSNIELVVGSPYNDTIMGAGAPFEGFEGRGGNDTIDGGASFDEVSYVFAAGAVIADLSAVGDNAHDDPSDTVDAGIGIDTLYNIESILGTIYADHLTGNSLGNRLRGHAGADTLDGGLGNDEASYQSATVGIVANISASPYTAGATIVAVGTALDGHGSIDELISIENLRGSAFADILVGSGGENSLRGDAGNDTLIGGGGNDTLLGGDGNDLLIPNGVDNPGPVELIDGGNGTDTLDRTSAGSTPNDINLALGTNPGADGGVRSIVNVENVIAGDGDDTITGSASANRLEGRGGTDQLIGGAGNDILVGGSGADTFKWSSGDEGTASLPAVDTISDFDTVVGSDRLDLRDILVGETPGLDNTAGNLGDFLEFSLDGSGNTVIGVSTTAGGSVTQKIVLSGVDLVTGTTSESQIIENLLVSTKLIAGP